MGTGQSGAAPAEGQVSPQLGEGLQNLSLDLFPKAKESKAENADAPRAYFWGTTKMHPH